MKSIIQFLFIFIFVWIITIQSFSQTRDYCTPEGGILVPPVQSQLVDRKPIPYAFVREADVMWAKRIWRVIDMREKINHPLYYPTQPQNGRQNLMYVILCAIQEGSIVPYEYDPYNDEFLVPLTSQELFSGLSKTDTVTLQRPYEPYDWYDTVIVKEFDPSSIKLLRLKEDWFFDRQRSVQEVRIIGICPVVEQFDDNFEFKGYQPLFWIYFPKLRYALATRHAFNRHNDAKELSYDDLFLKRMFGSYIYKEANVYDRKIGSYTKSLDALLEAERIKNELFLIEHDLWEF